jgi:erythrocyte band 7 integral membrane protein
MGRLREGAARGPGTLFILPCVDSCYVLDLRTVTFDVPPQEILTHDAVTVSVDVCFKYLLNSSKLIKYLIYFRLSSIVSFDLILKI